MDPGCSHTIYRTDKGIKLQFIFLFFFYSPLGLFQKNIKQRNKQIKKKAAQFWATGEQEGLTWSQPGDVLDGHLCSCSELSNFRPESSVLPISKLSRLFLQCWFLLGWTVRAHTVRCASRSTVRPSKGSPASCTNFLSKKKKRTTIGHSKNPRTVRKRKILAGTSDRRTGEGDKMRELHCFLHSKVVWTRPGPGPDAPSLTQTLIIQSVYSMKKKRSLVLSSSYRLATFWLAYCFIERRTNLKKQRSSLQFQWIF